MSRIEILQQLVKVAQEEIEDAKAYWEQQREILAWRIKQGVK